MFYVGKICALTLFSPRAKGDLRVFACEKLFPPRIILSTTPPGLPLPSLARAKFFVSQLSWISANYDETEYIRIFTHISTTPSTSPKIGYQNEGRVGTTVLVFGPSPAMRYLWVLVRQVVPSEKDHRTG